MAVPVEAVALQSPAMNAKRRCVPLLAAALALSGCATTAPLPYDAVAERAAEGVEMAPDVLQAALLAAPDFDVRLRQLASLEGQALALLADQPLRLGAIGSAILDHYYGSLAGHLGLARFYREVGADDQADLHDAWVAAIRTALQATGDGSAEAPYSVLSPAAAEALLQAMSLRLAGATYSVEQPTEGAPETLRLWTLAAAGAGPVRSISFRLQGFAALASRVRQDKGTLLPAGRHETCANAGLCEDFDARTLVHLLAFTGDDAAQTTLGFELMRAGRGDDGQRWLRQAARTGNALANLGLAELYAERARRASPERRDGWLERVEQQFQEAIDAGLDEAMLHLGRMYLAGLYDHAGASDGIALLGRAGALGNVDALLALGWLHAEGGSASRDLDLAERHFVDAAERADRARIEYARFLLHPPFERDFNDRAWRWLRELATEEDPRAMLLVGHLYAKGVHVTKRLRRARLWFKRAAEAAPDDANLVNEVAWTLTVSHLPRLRDERYALAIMEHVMADEDNAARRNPAYLDTWAAAYAANGNFERAIAVQEEAIELAVANDDPNGELAILREHLHAFRAGEPISDDTVP